MASASFSSSSMSPELPVPSGASWPSMMFSLTPFMLSFSANMDALHLHPTSAQSPETQQSSWLVEGKMWKSMKGTGQLCTMWWVVNAYAAASLSGRIKMPQQHVGMQESMGHDGRCHA